LGGWEEDGAFFVFFVFFWFLALCWLDEEVREAAKGTKGGDRGERGAEVELGMGLDVAGSGTCTGATVSIAVVAVQGTSNSFMFRHILWSSSIISRSAT
jgi:hypothetical protein